MKHVTYSEKSLLVDDDAAEALIEYARLLAQSGDSDTVTLTAIGADGNNVDATFLLTPSTILMVESANSSANPPPNPQTTEWLRDRIRRYSAVNSPGPEEDEEESDVDEEMV
jgi:hypothetical protein